MNGLDFIIHSTYIDAPEGQLIKGLSSSILHLVFALLSLVSHRQYFIVLLLPY